MRRGRLHIVFSLFFFFFFFFIIVVSLLLSKRLPLALFGFCYSLSILEPHEPYPAAPDVLGHVMLFPVPLHLSDLAAQHHASPFRLLMLVLVL